MKIKNLVSLLCFFLASSSLIAQNDSISKKIIQVSFIHPIGIYGTSSADQINHLSFNVLYGVNGGLSGFEFGGIANRNHGPVNGLQVAGLINNNLTTANGILIAGLSNTVGDSCYCISIAGLTNRFAKSGGGMQVAGLTNIVDGNFIGMQAAGLRNKANGNYTGLQVAGLTNYNKGYFNGIQVGGITNINIGDFNGMQIGLINRAKKVNGMQIGLINIANDYEFGIPVGLLSIVKNGFNTLDLSYNESVNYTANLKLGVDHFYNIFKFGYMPQPKGDYFSYGLGIGSMINLSDRFKIALDASSSYITEKKFTPTIDFLTEGQLSLRYNILQNVGIFAGPSFNAYFGEYREDGSTLLYVPKPIYNEDWWYGSGQTKLWIGYNAGVSIMF
ncbi:MAG: hypothetical protein AB8B74_05525 [Crocinitomicaceae bacterium]